jgi:AAA ATPase domain/Adenylate and Guanylate cyclase catalytic domain/Tetratricopeptide repeat
MSVHEDDARRAVKTALEMQAAAGQLDYLGPLQIGITQGVVLVGTFGGPTRRTYGAMGDDVNLAARLMETAVPGEILVSGNVQKATADDFVFEPRPPLPMKGKAEPLPVFLVTGERQQRAIRLQEPTYALPMVGRQAELQTVNDKLDLALRGKSQVVGIVAEAGMGKSRLVAEVIRLARRKGFAGYGGACQSDAIHTPYQAWKSIWSAFFDVDPAAPLRKQIRLLEGEIEDRAPERVQALPLLNILLNLAIPDNEFTQSLEPKYRQSVLYALLEDCLRAAAQEEPLLIVLEDLHWIDALSHDLLEDLAQALADSRVCFVLAYRPLQLAQPIAQRLEDLPNFTRIELRELNIAEAGQAIRAKLGQLYPARSGGVPAVLVENLMARAEGNPFFLEELLNFLRDRGLDPRDPAVLNKIELPDSMYALILSRIDQLSEREKTALRVASIIGRLFRVDWLTGYYPELGTRSTVNIDLEQLAKLDITPLASPEPELAYLFKHIITHEVTYESLPFATRARLHQLLAEYLEEQIAAGKLAEGIWLDTLVYHYLRTENRAKQRQYLLKAGQAALEVSAYNTAWEYLKRLVELTPADDPGRSALALKLAEAPYSLNNFPAAQAAIQQALDAATTDADRAAALALLGEMTSLMGDYAAAQTTLAEAVPLARASRDPRALCRALYALGDVYWKLGAFPEARQALDESLALARALGDMTRELFALNRLGVTTLREDLDEAERLFKEVHTRALAAGNRERTMAALINLGNTASERQDFVAAREYTYQAYALARVLGVQDVIALGALNLAANDISLGQFAAARAEIHEGLALALRIGLPPRVLQAVRMSAYLYHYEGQTGQALALLGLAQRQPAWTDDNQYDVESEISEWGLDPAEVASGLAKGAALDWDLTIQELLKG